MLFFSAAASSTAPNLVLMCQTFPYIFDFSVTDSSHSCLLKVIYIFFPLLLLRFFESSLQTTELSKHAFKNCQILGASVPDWIPNLILIAQWCWRPCTQLFRLLTIHKNMPQTKICTREGWPGDGGDTTGAAPVTVLIRGFGSPLVSLGLARLRLTQTQKPDPSHACKPIATAPTPVFMHK